MIQSRTIQLNSGFNPDPLIAPDPGSVQPNVGTNPGNEAPAVNPYAPTPGPLASTLSRIPAWAVAAVIVAIGYIIYKKMT